MFVKDRIHTSIRNKKDTKSSGKTYSSQAVVDRGAQQLWTEGLSSCATCLPYEGHTAQSHANTSMTVTITTALAHTQVTNAPNSPVQAVDLAQKDKITSQADLSSNSCYSQ